MTDLTPVRRRPLSPADVSLRYEDVLDQTQYPNLMSSTGCKGWRVMITFSLSHIHAHIISSLGGTKEVTESPRPSIPPSRLPTSDLSRQPTLVPEHDKLWDSGGVTPSSGPSPLTLSPSTPHSFSPPLGFAPGSRSSETLLQTTKASPNKKKKEREASSLCVFFKLQSFLRLLFPLFYFLYLQRFSLMDNCVEHTDEERLIL